MLVEPPSPIAMGLRLCPGPEDWRRLSATIQRPPTRAAIRAPIPDAFERKDAALPSRPLSATSANADRPGPAAQSVAEPSRCSAIRAGPLLSSVATVHAVIGLSTKGT